jgi:hypothetical protein
VATEKRKKPKKHARINLHGQNPEDVLREVMKVKPEEKNGNKRPQAENESAT